MSFLTIDWPIAYDAGRKVNKVNFARAEDLLGERSFEIPAEDLDALNREIAEHDRKVHENSGVYTGAIPSIVYTR